MEDEQDRFLRPELGLWKGIKSRFGEFSRNVFRPRALVYDPYGRRIRWYHRAGWHLRWLYLDLMRSRPYRNIRKRLVRPKQSNVGAVRTRFYGYFR